MTGWRSCFAGFAIIVLAAALLAGCKPGPASPNLVLSAEFDREANTILLSLDNVNNRSLFVPVNWTGITIYQDVAGQWQEFMFPDLFQPMLNTRQERIQYTIPVDTWERGEYRFVVQGLVGVEGTPFSVQAQVNISTAN